MNTTLLDMLAREINRLFDPISYAVENPRALSRLLAAIGMTDTSTDRDTLIAALSAVIELKTQIEELAARPSPSLDSIATLLDLVRQTFTAVQALNDASQPAGAFADLGTDLASLLVTGYLHSWYPLVRNLAVLATLIEPAEELLPRPPVVQGDQLLRGLFSLDRFHFNRVVDLVRDPATTLRTEYGNALATAEDASAMGEKLFPRLASVLRALHVPCRYGITPGEEDLLGGAAPFVKNSLIIYVEDLLAGAPAEAGVVLSLSSADRGDLGLVVSPFGTLTLSKQVGEWALELSFTADVDVLAYGRHGLTLVASPSTAEVNGSISATLAAPEEGPAFVFGSPDGSRLEVGGAQLKLETSLSESQQSLALSADVSSSAIVLAPGDGDGFLSSILPAEGMQAKFDLGLAWSNTHGLTLRGSGGLDATFPIGLSLGGVTLRTVHVSLQAHDASLLAEVSTTLGVSIGPVDAVIERVGLAADVTFPETGGNVGVANLDFRFKPPNGIGLVIDAQAVVGGGSLRFNEQKAEYSGMLELQIAERIAVKAIGLLSTRLTDGTKGYSLLILITAGSFPPIQLGFGFTLTAMGGLLAVNRTFAEDALRAGLKNHTLDSVLFPQDPLRNAPQILSNLNQVFPPADGHHLFGPMVQIAWGTPPLITADLGLVLEFGARRRLLVLGQVLAILPRREHELLRLQMDAVGVLDFDQGTAALDATLYDSRLLQRFPLTGDMAMRLQWEGVEWPTLALAVGGLHPAFTPPPKFPKLERLAINLSTGNNPRLRCEAYFALTSNTVQFGARAELYAAAAGFSLQGEIGFDVLIQLDPFHFLADFYAQVQLKRGPTNLFKVRVEGTLEGPLPLHIKGKATFEILWWDVTVRFNATLVGGVSPALAALIDVLPLFRDALSHPGNWRSQLPAGQRPLVTLRATPGAATDVRLHPLGTLTVTQSVVPLNLEISKFGQAVPAGERRFTLSVSVGAQSLTTRPVSDFFARAQFFEMSDDEKLSSPSFEPLEAGVSLGADAYVISEKPDDWLEVVTIDYDTILVGPEQDDPRRRAPQEPYALPPVRLAQQARFGAAGSSELRRTGRAKYRTTTGKYKLVPEGWSIVPTADLPARPAPGSAVGTLVTYSEAVQALRQLQQEDPAKAAGLKILRLSELPVSE